ncbi:MAG TPA: efflux RND transporter periplasmic adaptor subunit [Lacunisphaera sp.]|jgi:RND family efflux transporter MFP subunit
MKKILLFLLVAGLLIAGWFYFNKSKRSDDAPEEARPIARVMLALLKRQPMTETLEVFGVVVAAPSGERIISATFDCIVRKIDVAAGARVAAGDLLMEIEPNPEDRLQLDAARNALALATKSLASVQERYDLKLATNPDLFAARQAELDARQKVVSLERRGIEGDGRIVAPIAGVVNKLEASAGSSVNAGAALLTLTASEGLEATLSVELSDLKRIAAGQSVTLFSAQRAGAKPVDSKVRVAGASLDAGTGAVEVRASIPAGAPLLLGEHIRATIELDQKNTLAVPRGAVLPEGGKSILYTVKDGHAVRREVTPGISAGGLIEVSGENLREGDSVVVLGNYELEDGMAVQPADAGEKKAEAKP